MRTEWISSLRMRRYISVRPMPSRSAACSAVSMTRSGVSGVAVAGGSVAVSRSAMVWAVLDWIRGFTCTSAALTRLDPVAVERAVRCLRETLTAHTSDDGVRFQSRAWLITARSR